MSICEASVLRIVGANAGRLMALLLTVCTPVGCEHDLKDLPARAVQVPARVRRAAS